MQPLRSLDSALLPSAADAPRERGTQSGVSAFGELVARELREVNREQLAAEQSARDLAAGRADVVDAMLALSKADIALRFAVTLRNRALEAYQEIMRIQV